MAYIKALDASELLAGHGKCVLLQGKKIAFFRTADRILAVDDTCTHDEASLSEGTLLEVEGKCPVVECPWHGAHFDLCTGKAMTFPAVTPVKAYAAREINGAIEIDLT